jgi:hypothetical protein
MSDGQREWRSVPDAYSLEWNTIFSFAYCHVHGIAIKENCPICGEKELRQFYWKHRSDSVRCSVWHWCSSCCHYEHSTGIFPENWVSQIEIQLAVLGHSPEAIDRAFQEQITDSDFKDEIK